MLVIDSAKLDAAAEMLMIAAMEARNESGLRVAVDLPRARTPPKGFGTNVIRSIHDEKRIRAITLAAIISLTGETCRLSDEVHIQGFGDPGESDHGTS